MKSQIIQGVQKAFDAAGDLVTDMTLVVINSTYDVTSAQNYTNEVEYQIKGITNEVNLTLVPASLVNKELREYIVLSDYEIKPSHKVVLDSKRYNIWKAVPVSQNGTTFVTMVGIEK